MISKIDICNMALGHLGQSPISSLGQENESARRCNLFYEPVKREVLRTHKWGFAASFVSLALIEEKKQSLWPYRYAYPQDCLFIKKIFSLGQEDKGVVFKEIFDNDIHARLILTSIPHAQAEYTRDIQDEGLFDPAFVKAFSLALAADLAVTLTGDGGLAQRILQKYALSLDEARRSNMTENFDIQAGKSVFWEERG